MANLFLSHSSKNGEQANKVAAALERAGHVVFLDQDQHHGIVPGEPWQDRLLEELKRCRALVFLSSEAALASNWCQLEIAMALQQDKPVVTLDLEAGLPRHPLIQQDQGILFTGSLDDGVERLIGALDRLGIQVSPGGRWDPDRSPYPGLRSFDAADAGMYFGRDEDIRDVIGLLESSAEGDGVVTVVGASGVGKSSLLRAGVIPRLAASGAGSWVTVDPFEPQAHPADRLLGCIGALRTRYPIDVPATDDPVADLPRVAGALALAAAGPEGRLLITIDSLEQLLTVSTPEQRDRFLDLIRAVARGGVPVSLLLAIRLDQSEALQRLSPLGDLMRQPLFIAPLSRDKLDDIIEQPAVEAGLSLEPGLADRIADDAGSDRDKDGVLSLPLVAFTLQRMWQRMRADGRQELQLADYEAVGRIDGAIAQAATKAEAAASEQDQGQLDRLLTRFVTVSEQQSMVGRPVPLDQLSPEERLIASRLENERLLSGDGDQVQLTHDRLLSAWPRLAKLIQDRREDLLVRSRLERQAAEWRRSPSEVLSQPRTVQAEAWLGAHRDEASADVVALVAASTRHWRRKRANRLIAASAAAILVLLIGLLAVVSARQANQAEAADRTRRANLLAGQSLSEVSSDPAVAGWLALAADEVESTPRTRVALARAAGGLTRPFAATTDLDAGSSLNALAVSSTGITAAGDDRGSVHRWSEDGTEQDPIEATDGAAVKAVGFTPDGSRLAAGAADGTITVWDAATGEQDGATVDVGDDADDAIEALSYSPDGSALAVTTRGGDVLVWEVREGAPAGDPTGPREADAGAAIAYAPDGAELVVGTRHGDLTVYDPSSWSEAVPVRAHALEVNSLAISPEGVVVSGGEDGTVRIRTLAQPDHELAIRTGQRVASVAVLHDGLAVAAALLDGSVRVWDAETGEPAARPLESHLGQATGVARDVEGDRLLSIGTDGRLLGWPEAAPVLPGSPVAEPGDDEDPTAPIAADGDGWIAATEGEGGVALRRRQDLGIALRLDPPAGTSGTLTSLAFTQDGHVLLGATEEGDLWTWDIPSRPDEAEPVGGHLVSGDAASSGVTTVAASEDGSFVATGDATGTVQLRDPKTLEPTGPDLGEDGAEVRALSFSDDGSVLAAAGYDGRLRIWSTSSGRGRTIDAADGVLVSVAVSPDGDRVATGSLGERLIRIWDRSSGREAQPAIATSGPVTALAFAGDGATLVSADASSAVAAWDLSTGDALQEEPDAHVGDALGLVVDEQSAEILSVGRDAQIVETPCPSCQPDAALAAQLRKLLADEPPLTPAERDLYGLSSD